MPKLRSWIVPALREIEQKIFLEEQEKILAEEMKKRRNSLQSGGVSGEFHPQNEEDIEEDSKKQNNGRNSTAHHQQQQFGSNSATAKVLRSPVSMIDTTGGNLSMVHDLRSELRVFRRGLQSLAVSPALNK